MTNAMDLLNSALAAPITHVVITERSDGSDSRHEVRSEKVANIVAAGERRKVGRQFISRITDMPYIVTGVRVEAL